MPIEIKELVIRVITTPEADREQTQDSPAEPITEHDFDEIVEACVQRVLRVLKKSKER